MVSQLDTVQKKIPCWILLLLRLHPFLLLCGVDVSYLMRRRRLTRSCASSSDNSLRQVGPGTIQSPPLRSSSPSFARHIHHHHSLAHIIFYSLSLLNRPTWPHTTSTYFPARSLITQANRLSTLPSSCNIPRMNNLTFSLNVRYTCCSPCNAHRLDL